MKRRLLKALTIELTFFELLIVILSFIAVLGWLFLVYKISITLDNINKSFGALLGGGA